MRFLCVCSFLFSILFFNNSKAQVIADFESGALTPTLSPVGAEVRLNPNATGNSSDHVGYYQKPSGNWHAIYLDFANSINVNQNDLLTFKIYNSTLGRVYVKVDDGATVILEGWAPNYNFKPEVGKWVECSIDISSIKGKTFNRLEVNTSVDNDAIAEVFLDDFRLVNSSSPSGEPVLIFEQSANQVEAGSSIHFDASSSYDTDGTIQSFVWDFGDTNTSNESSVDHIYSNEGIYKGTITITDNEGKSSFREFYCYVFPVGGKISQLYITTKNLVVNKKIEGIFSVKGPYSNVYDPDEVTVDAIITLPDATSITIPCFYFEKATYKPDNWTKDGSIGFWMLRFNSAQVGEHKVSLKLKDSNGTIMSFEKIFTVAESSYKGFIQLDQNKQYYRHTTGEPFYPLGINVAWNTTSNYTSIVNNLSAGKANIIRYWQVPFDRQGLEWKNGNGFYKGLGIYSQEAAAEQDSMLTLCEAKNMYMQIALFQHGMFSENVDSNWSDNPYNSVNGGPLTKAEQYFYNAEAKARTKKLLRYIIARWGYSSSLFAWELFNEVQFTGNHPNQSAQWSTGVNTWHDEMSKYIKSIDAFNHLVTTSADDSRLPTLDKFEAMDNVQYHLYDNNLLATQTTRDKNFRSTLKSVINGEYGTNNNAAVPFDDQRLSIWTSIMNQTPHFMWVWDDYINSSWSDLFLYPAAYLEGEDFANEGTLTDWTPTAKYGTGNLITNGFNSVQNFYALIYDGSGRNNLSGATCDLSKLPSANYDVSFYNVLTGLVQHQNQDFSSTQKTLQLPTFSKAIAVKIKFNATIITAIDNTIHKNITPYPNPTTNDIFINLSGIEGNSITVEVSDVLGRKVLSLKTDKRNYPEGIMNLKLKDNNVFQSGIYIFKFQSESSTSISRIRLTNQ